MRSRLRIPLQIQRPDVSASVQGVGKTLRLMITKLERNWPLSAALMLLAMVVAAHL